METTTEIPWFIDKRLQGGGFRVETYDLVMLVVLIGATLFGAIKGFAWQLASIASIVVSYSVAYNFREPLSHSIQADPPWNGFLAMLILFIGTSFVIWVAFRMVSNTIDRLRLKEFDRQIGALFGLAKGALYCILLTLFAVTLLGDKIREKVVSSRSGHYIASVLDRSESIIPEEIHGVVGPYLDRFDQKFRKETAGVQEAAADMVRSAAGELWNGNGGGAWDAGGNTPLPVEPHWLPPDGRRSVYADPAAHRDEAPTNFSSRSVPSTAPYSGPPQSNQRPAQPPPTGASSPWNGPPAPSSPWGNSEVGGRGYDSHYPGPIR